MQPMTSPSATSGTTTSASGSSGVPGICMARGSVRASLASTGSPCSTAQPISPRPNGADVAHAPPPHAVRGSAPAPAPAAPGHAVDRQVVVAHHRACRPSAIVSSTSARSRVDSRRSLISSRRRCDCSCRASSADCSSIRSYAPSVGHRLRGVAGEDGHRLQVVVAELVVAQLRQGDHAHRSALEQHRHHQHRLLDVIGPLDGVPAHVVQRVVGPGSARHARPPSR